jgi:hypothetical protein
MRAWMMMIAACVSLAACGDREVDREPGERMDPQEFSDPDVETDGYGPIGDQQRSWDDVRREQERSGEPVDPALQDPVPRDRR